MTVTSDDVVVVVDEVVVDDVGVESSLLLPSESDVIDTSLVLTESDLPSSSASVGPSEKLTATCG